jgi:hypothetical protein
MHPQRQDFTRDRRRVPRLTRVVVGAALCVACDAPIGAVDCERLLDRYTELGARQVKGELRADELRALGERARALAAQDARFAECPRRISRRQLDCALAAPDVDAFERCLL